MEGGSMCVNGCPQWSCPCPSVCGVPRKNRNRKKPKEEGGRQLWGLTHCASGRQRGTSAGGREGLAAADEASGRKDATAVDSGGRWEEGVSVI